MREPHIFIVFGATGDLTARKLIPALHHLFSEEGDTESVLFGVSRSEFDDGGFRDHTMEALRSTHADEQLIGDWCRKSMYYHSVGTDQADWTGLRRRVEEVEERHGLSGNRVFYLALPPKAFAPTIAGIGASGLVDAPGWTRLVVEKPFGHDLASARELNATIHEFFAEEEVYRIDHYLGKETVQNLLVFRLANVVFESLWNRDRVDRVEITVAESIDVANRARYYDASGAVRDMIQNHLTQILTLTAMEPPATFTPVAIRNEKVKVLGSIEPVDPACAVFGQYDGGDDGESYLDHDAVAAGSTTPTYAAVKLHIDNWRWQGVPFFLRTGKALAARRTQIAVVFRQPPVAFFSDVTSRVTPDRLLITLQPGEGFELCIDVKRPGTRMSVTQIPLTFSYDDQFGPIADAYETLLGDIIAGDQTLFVRADEVEESWRIYAPLLDSDLTPHTYTRGSWGPEEANALLTPHKVWAIN